MFVRNKEEFRHYDSGHSSNSAAARELMDRLQPFLHGEMIVFSSPQPQPQGGLGIDECFLPPGYNLDHCECVVIAM